MTGLDEERGPDVVAGAVGRGARAGDGRRAIRSARADEPERVKREVGLDGQRRGADRGDEAQRPEAPLHGPDGAVRPPGGGGAAHVDGSVSLGRFGVNGRGSAGRRAAGVGEGGCALCLADRQQPEAPEVEGHGPLASQFGAQS